MTGKSRNPGWRGRLGRLVYAIGRLPGLDAPCRWLIVTAGLDPEPAQCTSIVLLLRQPIRLSEAALRSAAERAWERDFSTTEGSTFLVVHSKATSFVKVGPYVLKISEFSPPYLLSPPYLSLSDEDLEPFLPDRERRESWRAHRAWLAIDCWTTGIHELTKYSLLASLARNLADTNVVGYWIPKMRGFLPNAAGAFEELGALIIARPPQLS